MASLFTNPVQALLGDSNQPNSSPLDSAHRAARENIDHASLDSRWHELAAEVEPTRWNKSYPYQLLILDQSKGYSIMESFTLPIPPQAMSMSTPFAISTTVTLGGIVEEHNGAPIRTISFSGTTGVMPLKSAGQGLSQGSLFRGIFAGTLNGTANLVTNSKTLTGTKTQPNLVLDSDTETLKGSGYYQFRLLQRFLEYYVALKKGVGSKTAVNPQNIRLAVALWKDQSVYLVTPVSFELARSAQSPWEYQYNLNFKAWRRVSPNSGKAQGDVAGPFTPIVRDPNAFAQALSKIQQSRRVLQSSRDVLLGVQADADRLLLEPLREVTLFCKDALGVALTLIDLPAAIIASTERAVIEASAARDFLKNSGRVLKAEWLKTRNAMRELGLELGIIHSDQAVGGTVSQSRNDQSIASSASEVNRIFQDPSEYADFLELIRPSDLNLNASIQKSIGDERTRVRQLTRFDFEKYRDQFVEFMAQFADAVGAGSDDYDQTFNRPKYRTDKTPTTDDFSTLFALNDTILEMNKLAATSDIDNRTTTVESVAGMASASGIAFTVPVSKFAVPFPYGQTLEQLALQYLGDANRWHEIVALNGLRRPYVDEDGFDLPLLVNGDGNEISVADASNLYIGQGVTLSSTGTSTTQRHIIGIDKVSAGNYTLTLDGDSDLSRFTTGAKASLHAFLPDTVNSQQLIYIPSDEQPLEDDYRTKAIPGVDQFDQLLAAGGVDLLLTHDGDLAITPDGDCRLAVGLTNLIQQVRIAIGTPRGSLLHHPDYGLGLAPGVSTADLDATQMASTLRNLFRGDPSFSGVSNVSVVKNGPVCTVTVSIGIAGTNQVIPVTVNIKA